MYVPCSTNASDADVDLEIIIMSVLFLRYNRASSSRYGTYVSSIVASALPPPPPHLFHRAHVLGCGAV
jgi:hypothetical protein